MLTFTSAQWSAWVAAFIFPLARILALIASSPILGNKQVPVHVKIGLSVMMTIIIAPTLNIQPGIEPGSATGIFILLQQMLAGLAMGFTMRIIFTAVETVGELAGLQMGLGFASFYDPQHASFSPVLAQFLGIIVALAFLSMDGHLYMLAALADSFQTFPISTALPSALALHTLAIWVGSIFSYALQLSLPLLGALLITNLALGILTRSAPQLNLFAVGFPITLAIGFLTLAMSLPYFGPLLDKITHDGLGMMQRIAHEFASQP
ncbi:MAG: flagellar biosynthetic protein FliR [Sideroxydans sp.]|nr:flagellar biosynthetic protein FliR [Sideroxydans sp.]